MDAAEESQVLFVVGDREPVLDELDARSHQHAFELGHVAEELLDLVLGAKAHHPLDAGAVVPTAVEQDDLAGCGQVRHVALEVPLGSLAVVGRGQGHDAGDARVQALGDALDDAPLACRVATLEQDHRLVSRRHHPLLQLHQFALQPEQFAEVLLPCAPVLLALFGAARDAIERAILEFEFELLVVAILQIVADAADQFVIRLGHGKSLFVRR